MEKLVIVPTYNEVENIDVLLERLLALPHGLDVLVVDDGSPDGTADHVKAWQAKTPRVHLLQRPGKMGLGSAYRDGFRYALANGAEYIFEMDADFSHDPDAIGDFLEAAKDADIVLGSRYLHGVTVVNWPLSRLILSYSANVYTRIITGMPLADATGGFKCFRREVLEAIDLQTVTCTGYAFQIEMKFTAWKHGFRIIEVPIIFTDRTEGTSKMSKGIFKEAIVGVLQMKWKSFFRHYEKKRA